MKAILPILIAFILLGVYLIFPETENTEHTTNVSVKNDHPPLMPRPKSGKSFVTHAAESDSTDQVTAIPSQVETGPSEEQHQSENSPTDTKTPELNFALEQSTHFMILGNAENDNNQMDFKSELLPSNEVFLSIKLEQQDIENIELKGYFDLANFTMELDGGNRVLNKEHKRLLKQSGEKLQTAIREQYADYDIPEHALMLAQMLAYWSVSPEGFVHEKRVIVSQ